jgi:hypothetical protein
MHPPRALAGSSVCMQMGTPMPPITTQAARPPTYVWSVVGRGMSNTPWESVNTHDGRVVAHVDLRLVERTVNTRETKEHQGHRSIHHMYAAAALRPGHQVR